MFIEERERERKRERERERKRGDIDVREYYSLVASCAHPDQAPNMQPR